MTDTDNGCPACWDYTREVFAQFHHMPWLAEQFALGFAHGHHPPVTETEPKSPLSGATESKRETPRRGENRTRH